MKKIIAMLVLAAALVCGPVAVSGQTVRDAMGTNKGRIERSGTVRDSQGRYLGKLGHDRVARDGQGRYKGRMDSDGTVRDSQGRCLGKLSASNRRSAALLFFFDFFDL